MLSPASQVNRWIEGRSIRRSIALPFVGVLVGLCLTSTSATSRASQSRERDAAASVESTSPVIVKAQGLLHAPSLLVETQRRTAPVAPDLLAAQAETAVRQTRATAAIAASRGVYRPNFIARGYDATAPPVRFV